jgi:predicted DNA-binding protein (MmcQ/YjbR family)
MDHKTVEEYILSQPNSFLDYPFGEGVAVYKVPTTGPSEDGQDRESKLFAIIQEGTDPLRISLKCDPQLAELLREKYETVLPGYHLNKKHWNTIILTGQLPWEEMQGLIVHSYNLVVGIH